MCGVVRADRAMPTRQARVCALAERMASLCAIKDR
jgi:hypothetical protein